MANLASGDGGSGTTTEEEEPTGDPYQGAQTGSDVYRPGSGSDDTNDNDSSSSSGSSSSTSRSSSGSTGATSRTSSQRAEEIKRRAAEAAAKAAAGTADSINIDEGVDQSKSRNKEVAERAQRVAEMAPPTNHTLETMDQSSRVSDMARVSGDPFAGATAGSDVYRPGTGGDDTDSVTDPSSSSESEAGRTTSPQTGLEVTSGPLGQQAKAFEESIIAQNPSLNADDIAIQRDGDQLVASYTASGRQQIQNRLERSARGAAQAVVADPGFGRQGQEEFVQSIRGAAEAVEADTGTNPLNIRVDSPRQQSGPVNQQTAEAIQQEIFRTRLQQKYPNQDFSVRRTQDGFQAVASGRRQQKEQFGDFDWSFGLGGPEDEVERALDDASDTITETSRDVAEGLFGTEESGESGGEILLDAVGQEDLGDEYDREVRNLGKGMVEGVGAIANVPGLVGTGLELTEYGGYFGSKAVSGEGADASEQTYNAAKGLASEVVEQATENPARTTGAFAGALVGSYGAISTARSIGPRAATATRYAIQPGEEVAGSLGYKAVRRARGAEAAERYFPGGEPLIFSEEAGLKAGKKAAAKIGEVSPTRRIRRAAGEVSERTPTARLVKDPDSGLVSVDSELVAEIGDAARRYREAFSERASPSGELRGTRDLRAGSDLRPESALAERTPQIGSSREGVRGLIEGAQRPSVEGSLVEGGASAVSGARDLLGTAGTASREGLAPLVRGAQRPSLEGQFVNRAARTARDAQNLIDTVRSVERGDLSLRSTREGVAPLVRGAQRPSLEGALFEFGGQTRQAVRNTEFFGSSDGRSELTSLVAGAQGPSLEGQASEAFNLLAFEGRRRRLQAGQAARDLPGRIADTRRAYSLALQSDVAETASGLDTRYRQTRSLLSDAELPSHPTTDGVRGRLSGLGDYTLRLEPSTSYWDSDTGSTVPTRVDVGDFEGLDVEGVLGDFDTRNVDAETETDTDPVETERDAGDGLVALEAESDTADPIDTSRTGTGTDMVRSGRAIPVSRSLASAAEPVEYSGVGDLPAGSELVDTRPDVREQSVQAGRSDLDIGQDFEVDSLLETETVVETDQTPRSEFETQTLLETRQQSESEAETETLLESSPEFEPEGRGNESPDRPWERDFEFTSADRSSGGDPGIGAGWYNEFLTAYALGAGPREVAEGQDFGAVALTEQRQTKAQAQGSEEIDDVEAAFLFEGLGAGLSGNGSGDLLPKLDL